jgi:hypothetical protein
VSRLPDKYREIIVLCDLEGKTRKQVARHLSVPEGTVASRLATARAMLARRLARSGLAVSSGALAALLSQHAAAASMPLVVVSNTITAASHFAAGQVTAAVSVQAVALAEGVSKAMLLSKLKIATTVLMALAVFGASVAALTQERPAEKQPPRTNLVLADKPPAPPVQVQIAPPVQPAPANASSPAERGEKTRWPKAERDG